MQLYLIYRHLNKINGKSYIGLTRQKLSKRWRNGNGYTKKHQPAFYNAIKKYGWENFEHIILEDNIQTIEEANEREKYWIAYYHTWIYDPECNGYNITIGGDGTGGHKMPEAMKEKNRKQIYCIELDKYFNSLTEAAEATKCSVSKICECCRGKRNSTGGYHWQYVNQELKDSAINFQRQRYDKKINYFNGLKIAVYCKVDDQIIHFASKDEAAKWWFNTYHPFGQNYTKSVYFTKISQSIENKVITTGKNQYDNTVIDNIQWFLEEQNNE